MALRDWLFRPLGPLAYRIFIAVCFLTLVGVAISLDVTLHNRATKEIAALREENERLDERVTDLTVSVDLEVGELKEKAEAEAERLAKIVDAFGGIHHESVRLFVRLENIQEDMQTWRTRLGLLEEIHWELENIVHCMAPNTPSTDEECADFRLPNGKVAKNRYQGYR